MILITSVSKN